MEKKQMKENKKIEKKSEDISKKDENKIQNRQLRNILIFVGIIALLIVAIVIIGKSATKFTYRGVEFDMVKEGDLMFYATSLPVQYQGETRDYNFYLRKDARKSEVPFNGTLDLKSNAVLNMEKDFTCGGIGIIAIQNMLNLYKFIGINVMSDENASCDTEAKYTFIQILEGNETKIEQFGQSCYNVYVNNCEILEATEKLMIETLVKVNDAV
jgi:predicted nucleic acid-binding Zn ribbon protein